MTSYSYTYYPIVMHQKFRHANSLLHHSCIDSLLSVRLFTAHYAIGVLAPLTYEYDVIGLLHILTLLM